MRAQFAQIERLGQVVVGSGFHRSTDMCDPGLSGEHDHGEVPRSRVGADTLNDFIPQQPRHHESAENEVEVLAPGPLEPRVTITFDQDIGEADAAQVQFDESSSVRIALDDEDLLVARTPPVLLVARSDREDPEARTAHACPEIREVHADDRPRGPSACRSPCRGVSG